MPDVAQASYLCFEVEEEGEAIILGSIPLLGVPTLGSITRRSLKLSALVPLTPMTLPVLENDHAAAQRILKKLRGQRVLVPGLQSLFESWPNGVNPLYQELRPRANNWLARYD